jgi:hypothetical protein
VLREHGSSEGEGLCCGSCSGSEWRAEKAAGLGVSPAFGGGGIDGRPARVIGEAETLKGEGTAPGWGGGGPSERSVGPGGAVCVG